MTVPRVSVVPARLERTPEGIPWAGEFGDVYHSSDGGLAQARHVFLGGNGLPGRWAGRECFTILETGFGLGLNFLATWDALRRDASAPERLHFVSVERHPFSAGELADALAPFREVAALAAELVERWPPPLAGFHRMAFDRGQVILTLLAGDARALLPSLHAQADALYLDGFAPSRNPEMWSAEVVREWARLAHPGATLATWTVAGGVRAALQAAGFRLESRAGFGRKREMLAGVRDGQAAKPPRGERRAAIVGGGLAGTLCAERLASRGWAVQILDGREQRANARSGLVRPVINARDALNAQLSRPAFLYALQHGETLAHDGFALQGKRSGILQLAKDASERARFAAIAQSQGWPADVLRYVDEAEAADIAGRAVRGGGWWMPAGAWISPESLAFANLARAGSRVDRRTGRAVARIAPVTSGWQAFDADGTLLAEAPVMILANARDAARLAPHANLPLHAVRGQVTYLPPSPDRALAVAVSGEGYLAPLPGGGHAVGASFQHDDDGLDVRLSDHRENLARAESLLPGFAAGIDAESLEGWAGLRTTVPDRLPIFGEGERPGLWFATGLGSRGLLWAPLGAELLASALAGEPAPLPSHLAAAISPRRFLR